MGVFLRTVADPWLLEEFAAVACGMVSNTAESAEKYNSISLCAAQSRRQSSQNALRQPASNKPL